MSKKGAEIGQWDARYQGRDLRCRIEKLVPGAEYLSRLKARHQNITGNESEVVPFKTSTDAPGTQVEILLSRVLPFFAGICIQLSPDICSLK